MSVPAVTSKVSPLRPPVSRSLPSRPDKVSACVPPIRVSLKRDPVKTAALPVLVRCQPLPRTTEERSTPYPEDVNAAWPSLKLLAVALQLCTTRTSARAPDCTCNSSAPTPRSMTSSRPPWITNRSMPARPMMVSLPAPLVSVSLNAEPPMRSMLISVSIPSGPDATPVSRLTSTAPVASR